MPRVATCPECTRPVVYARGAATGETVTLDVYPVAGGRYKLDGEVAVPRKRRAGRGHNEHACQQQTAPNTPPDAASATLSASQHPPAPPTPPAAIIEAQELTGPQAGTGYVDCTGTPPGPALCSECSAPIVVAYHHLRPDGTRPVLLHGERHHRGPWRAFRKIEDQRAVYAQFCGDDDPSAEFVNHRLLCPEAKPV